MLRGKRVIVRPMQDADLPTVSTWAGDPAKAIGDYQRYQLELSRMLSGIYAQTGLISRDNGFLVVEVPAAQKIIGFVRYATSQFPDPDIPLMDIGYAIAEHDYRGQGYATEAVGLVVDYVFGAYPVQRLSAYTDAANAPSRRLLERLGFSCEGTIRSANFHHGAWHDLCVYGILRPEWTKISAAGADQARMPDEMRKTSGKDA